MTPGSGKGRALAGLAILLGVGVAIRAGAAATAALWFDEATAGLMGRRTLLGEFLLYFHGQAYMGAVDGYLHALPFALLGSSLDTIRLFPVLLSLLHVALVALLVRRVTGDGRWAAVVALVPTPILLKFAHDGRLFYDLVPVCTLLLVLLGLQVVEAPTAPGRTRAVLVAGLLAGLAWWTNLIQTVAIVAVAGVVVLGRPRLRLAALAAPATFLLGSVPFWVFAATRGHLAAIRTPLAELAALPGQAQLLLTHALPLLLGLPPRALTGAAGPVLVGMSLLVLAAALAVCLARGGTGGWLVAGVVALGSAAVVVAEHGRLLGGDEPLYLLPVIAVLPAALGILLAQIARRSVLGALALTLVLLGGHLAGLRDAYPQLFSWRDLEARRQQSRWPVAMLDRLVAAGETALYTHDPEVLTFASAERVTVAHFYQERYPPLADLVDAAPKVAYFAPERIPAGFLESLAAAGIRFDREETPRGPLLSGFRLELAGLREIPPTGWSATASARPELAGHAIDRDAGTRWRTTGRPAGAWLQVDLGRVHQVGMVAWLPGSYQEVPVGFRLETSVDGSQFTVAREVPTYYGPLYWAAGHPMGRVRWGRVEVRFPARPARYVRLTHLGQDDRYPWTVRELFAYETGQPPAESPVDPREAASALLAMGARHVYADHGEGPRLVAASGGRLLAPPDNVAVDRYGLSPPLERLPFLSVATDAAIAFPRDAPSGPSIEAALRAAGVGFVTRDAGGYRLLGRLDAAAPPAHVASAVPVRVAAEPADDDPRDAVDGRVSTRWSTRVPQAPSQWLEVELDAPAELGGLELDLGGSTLEYPRDLAVRVPRDGGWEDLRITVRWVGPLVWTGTHVLRAGVERIIVTFPPTRVRTLRVVQTGREALHPWSVAELRLLAP